MVSNGKTFKYSVFTIQIFNIFPCLCFVLDNSDISDN